MIRKTIMMVDDDPVVLESFKRGLKGEGYEIITADNSEKAIEKLKIKPDIKVIISDIKMPGMDGLELLKLMKKEYPYAIRIVLTGYADVENAIAAINQGQVYRFITKPWDIMELRIIVRLALQYQQSVEEFRLPARDIQGAIESIENLENRYPGISTISRDKKR
jgi:DNA-binding NtrC family response regulator